VIAVARLLLASLLVLEPVLALDQAVRAQVQAARLPQLEPVMRGATGLGRPLLVLVAVGAAISGPAGRAVLVELGVGLVPVNVAVEGLKWSVGRVRPDGDAKRRNSSFPSSHAANAAAVAAVMIRRWRWSAVVWVPLAALIAFSRMYLDRHWLSDVVSGAVIGAALALGAVHMWASWRARRREVAHPDD
jgi:undecaprenyl-diphosphatase